MDMKNAVRAGKVLLNLLGIYFVAHMIKIDVDPTYAINIAFIGAWVTDR